MKVHIWGASGYAAAEAIRLIATHPALELGVLESRSHAGSSVAQHFPDLRTLPYRFSEAGSVLGALRDGEFVIAAGGHGEAIARVPEFLKKGARVVDLSADFRFDDNAVYGLTEWNRAPIADAALVANPGCYPTASLLALLPLLHLKRARQLVVDAKSGITGAGRNPSLGALYAEVARDIRPYGLDQHRHQPEIERVLAANDTLAPLVFTPHVVPLSRGMLADAYAMYDTAPDEGAVQAAFARAYAGSPFVRVLEEGMTPSVAAVVGTNDAEIRVDVLGNTVRVLCAIDNLGKGAAGQAIQNLNVMLGIPEETGFGTRAILA
jgi:N-acetyl-gamma-glutamyl-phosphate reductase